MEIKHCHACDQDLPVSSFYFNAGRPDGISGYCAPCHTAASKASRDARRLKAIEHLGARCVACGYDADIRALQIDHIDGGGRKEYLSTGSHKMLKAILAGAEGYQVLCANCNVIKRYDNAEHKGDRVYTREEPQHRVTSREWTEERRVEVSAKLKAASDAAGPEERARRGALTAATRKGIPRARPEGQWSLRHAACVECGRTSQPHAGLGLCATCTHRARRERRKAAADE